jgi:hypothetical protein
LGWAVMCGWLGESTAAGLGCGLRASDLGPRAAGCRLRATGRDPWVGLCCGLGRQWVGWLVWTYLGLQGVCGLCAAGGWVMGCPVD